ncbi:MAG: DUF4389 domain-containing protein [Ilumatobacteraceae bacterium]
MTTALSAPQAPYYVIDSPNEIARWRPLVHWLLFIPHALILYGLRGLACVVALLYWLVLVFTGRLDRNLFGMMAMYERYTARATGFLLGFSDDFPPFDFRLGGADNDAYTPITLNLPEPPETGSRKLAFNVLLAIPHYVVFALYAIGAIVAVVFAWFAVLFTGRWPIGVRNFLVKLNNYYYRVWLYATMVEPAYPSFTLN